MVAHELTFDALVYTRHLPHLRKFAERYPDLAIVIDHAAKPDIAGGGWQPWADRIAAVARCAGVLCKVSGLVTEADHARWTPDDLERYLDHVFALFGPERVMWGSDWPVCLLAADYGAVHDVVADYVARQCPAAAPAIFGGTAAAFYGVA